MGKSGLERALNELATRSFDLFDPIRTNFEVVDYAPMFEPAPHEPVLYNGDAPRPRALGKKPSEKIVARYHEQLTHALYGAAYVRARFEATEGRVGYPDLWDPESNKARETKALGPNTTFDVRDGQIGYMGDFQYKNPETTILFHLFRYRQPPQRPRDMTPQEMLAFLTKAPAFSLVLPLSVVHKLYSSPSGDKGHRRLSQVHRYQGSPKWETRTRVQSGVVNRFVHEPEKVLAEIGLDPEAYVVSYTRVSLPVSCHGVPITPFPIVTLRDRNHGKWVRSFLGGYPNNLVYPHTVPLRSAAPVPLYASGSVRSHDPLYDPFFESTGALDGCSDEAEEQGPKGVPLEEELEIPF